VVKAAVIHHTRTGIRNHIFPIFFIIEILSVLIIRDRCIIIFTEEKRSLAVYFAVYIGQQAESIIRIVFIERRICG